MVPLLALLASTLLIVGLALLVHFGDPFVSDLAMFLAVFAVVTTLALMIGNGDVLNPYYLVIVLYALYSCSAASGVVVNSPGLYGHEVLRTYYLSVTVGLVALAAGYRSVARSRSRVFQGLLDRAIDIDQRKFERILVFLMVAGIVIQGPKIRALLLGGNIRAYTAWALESAVAFRSDSWSGVMGYVQGLTTMILFGAGFFFLIRQKGGGVKLLVAAGICAYLLLTVMMGQKRGVLSASFLTLLYVHYRVARLRPAHLLPPALVLYVFAVMISNVRYTTSISEMTQAAAAMIRESPAVLLPFNAGELNGPPVTLLDIVDAQVRKEMAPSWGRTLVTEMMVWIPRAFFPDRPLPLSETYMQIFFPAEYARGAGHGFFIPTEGYWAFGVFGVFLMMFAYGAAIAALYRLLTANPGNDAVLLIYGLAAFTLVFTGIRTGLIGTLRATIMDAGPFMLLAWLCLRRPQRNLPR